MEKEATSDRAKRWLIALAAGAMVLLCSFTCGLLASRVDSAQEWAPLAWLGIVPTAPSAVPVDSRTPTLVSTGRFYDALIARLENDTVREVRFAGRDLVVLTRLDRASDSVAFYGQIGAIHGAVVKLDPDADRLVVQDDSGWQLIVPMEDLHEFTRGLIDYRRFHETWIEIEPD